MYTNIKWQITTNGGRVCVSDVLNENPLSSEEVVALKKGIQETLSSQGGFITVMENGDVITFRVASIESIKILTMKM